MIHGSKYNVIATSRGRQVVTYGWRCSACGIPTKRYAQESVRDSRLAEHRAQFSA